MTKRQLILEHIRVEVATAGRVTSHAIDLYCSHRVSREAFQIAIDRGMEQYRAKQQATLPHLVSPKEATCPETESR